jgi:hypothetical protein
MQVKYGDWVHHSENSWEQSRVMDP